MPYRGPSSLGELHAHDVLHGGGVQHHLNVSNVLVIVLQVLEDVRTGDVRQVLTEARADTQSDGEDQEAETAIAWAHGVE